MKIVAGFLRCNSCLNFISRFIDNSSLCSTTESSIPLTY